MSLQTGKPESKLSFKGLRDVVARLKAIPRPQSPYQYEPLEDNKDIRLITLLPGKPKDDIWVEISHIRLDESTMKPDTRMAIRELQKTLPEGWIVHKMMDGRYLFRPLSSAAKQSEAFTPNHPDPNVDPSKYRLDEDACFEPSYDAISYAWSDNNNATLSRQRRREKEQYDIFVQPRATEEMGSSATASGTGGKLSVGRNLYLALQHLRYKDRVRRIWVDGICINQADDVEKSYQVRRMDKVYSLAYRVVAWLGPEGDSGDGMTLAAVEDHGKKIDLSLDGLVFYSAGMSRKAWPVNGERWARLYTLLKRRWFWRLWVVQEITLANLRRAVIQCGNVMVSFFCFNKAIRVLATHSDSTPLVGSLANCAKLVKGSLGGSLSSLVWNHADRMCKDPRDRIYGFLGVMPPGLAARIQPDYSYTVGEVYKAAFLAHIEHLKRWELFGVHFIDRKMPGAATTPSWVTDILTTRSVAMQPDSQFSSGHSQLEYFYDPAVDPNILEVTGLRCATVLSVGQRALFGLPGSSHAAVVQSWLPDNLDCGEYPTGDPLWDAYVITLIQNELRPRMDSSRYVTLADWKDFIKGTSFVRKGLDPHFDLSVPNEAFLMSRCRGWQFMTTDEGYIGLGPDGVEPGDIICVFLGCSRPLVLRPQPDGRFRLMGDSFVYGLHDATAFLGPLPRPWIVRRKRHPLNLYISAYSSFNTATGESTCEDPRLEPDPVWERIDLEDLGRERSGDDPGIFDFFRHRETGEIRNSDPRLLPEALEKRGVKLEKFKLI